MSDTDDIIGVIRIRANDGELHNANVTYVGGSVFGINFADMDAPPVQARKDIIEKWCKSGNMRLLNATRYTEILNGIDPVTGETATHHADGTEKTLIERELSNLQADGLVDSIEGTTDTSKAKASLNKKGDAGKPSVRRRQVIPDDAVSASEVPSTQVTPPIPNAKSTSASVHPMPTMSNSNVRSFDMPNNDSGYITKPKSSSGRVIGCVIMMSVMAVIALFATHALTDSIMDGTIGDTIDGVMGTHRRSDTKNASPNGDADTDATTTVSDGDTMTRTDYDPENDVSDKQMANDSERDIATGLFSAIRTCFSNGDVSGFRQIANLDGMADAIATSYANITKARRNLTDGDVATLMDYYKATLIGQEMDHASKNDIYGSMFGGRIREVRTDGTDDHTLYAVMESLGGDHQRVCFVLTGSDDGKSWAISSIVNVDAYVRQIMSGDTSQYVKRND